MGDGNSIPSALDQFVYFCGGSKPFLLPGETFSLPMGWMLTQLLLLLAVGFYPSRELKHLASNTLPRIGSMRSWWLSKCFSIGIFVSIFYIWCSIIFIISSLIYGGGLLSFHPMLAFPTIDNPILVNGEIGSLNLVLSFLLPLIGSLSLCLIQASLSLAIRSELTLAMLLTYIIVSIFTPTIFLIGDLGMLARTDTIIIGCYPIIQAISIFILSITFFVIVSSIYLARYDCILVEHQ